MDQWKEANNVEMNHIPDPGLQPVPLHSTLEHYEPSELVPRIPATADDESKRVCGLQKRTLLILVALAAVLIPVAAVAGGLGAALARSNRKSTDAAQASPAASGIASVSVSITSITVTAAATPSPSASTIKSGSLTLTRDCPATNGTTIAIAVQPAQTFLKLCSFLLSAPHMNAFDLVTTTLDACIALCANYNVLKDSSERPCNGVSWRYDPSFDSFGDCYGLVGLANMVGRIADGSTSDTPVDSAYLSSSRFS